MSVIQDAETANEQDTIQDERMGSEEEQPKQKLEANINLGKSILSNEEQSELLKKSIAKRSSILKEEEARRSAMNSQVEDQVMKDEGVKRQSELFKEVEVAVEECSEDEDLESEMRDVADEDLFDHLE